MAHDVIDDEERRIHAPRTCDHVGVRLMKRRAATAVTAMVGVGALAAKAQARPHSPLLTVTAGRAAITQFAGEVTDSLAKETRRCR